MTNSGLNFNTFGLKEANYLVMRHTADSVCMGAEFVYAVWPGDYGEDEPLERAEQEAKREKALRHLVRNLTGDGEALVLEIAALINEGTG